MKVILDECLPRRLGVHLGGHEVSTVPSAGYAGLENGKLLRAISGKFDAFVTVDAGIEYQQRLADYPIMTILVRARSNRLEDLLPLAPQILAVLDAGPKPGTVQRIQ